MWSCNTTSTYMVARQGIRGHMCVVELAKKDKIIVGFWSWSVGCSSSSAKDRVMLPSTGLRNSFVEIVHLLKYSALQCLHITRRLNWYRSCSGIQLQATTLIVWKEVWKDAQKLTATLYTYDVCLGSTHRRIDRQRSNTCTQRKAIRSHCLIPSRFLGVSPHCR